MDHDQRFKTLIKTFFQEFLLMFFFPWAERLNAAAVEWLDKEIFPEPPEGTRHILDLVGKLPTRQAVPGQRPGEPAQWLALVHIEIESPDKATPLRPRMFEAYSHLRHHHRLPVLPIGLYLRVGLEGIGTDVYEEHFWEFRPIHFEYLYVGLPALDAIEYLEGDNWLGVALAALMKIPKDRVAWLGAEALRRIQESPLSDQKRFLLGECVQAYLPLDEAQQQEFQRLVASEPYKGVQAMNKTWYEKGFEQGQATVNTTWYEKGVEKGRHEGIEKGVEKERRDSLRELLEERFGPLAQGVLARLEELPVEHLQPLRRAALKAQSLDELDLQA
jgi:hypothetical protein